MKAQREDFVRPMKRLLVCCALIALAGCTEAIKGPRVVQIHEDRFYIRHALTSSNAFVDEVAQSECAIDGRQAKLVSEDRYFPGDIRYATYTCVAS